MNTKFKRIQCLDRALDILFAVGDFKCKTIGEIAERSFLNQATAYNIVKTLEARGFIAEDQGFYVLGPKLGLLASSIDLGDSLPLLTKPILEQVNESTGEAVCITIMKGSHAEIINLMHGIRQVSVQFIHRSWDYPLNLGTGRLLVALGNPSLWENHIQRHLKSAPKNIAERDWTALKWRGHLEELRAQGFAILHLAPESEAESIGAVAVPVVSSSGAVLAAIGSSCPMNRATDEHLLFMKDSIASAIAGNPI